MTATKTKTLRWTRERRAPHIIRVQFPNGESAKVFGRERGLLGHSPFVVRFFDRHGDATGDRHEFQSQRQAKDFVTECFEAGSIG